MVFSDLLFLYIFLPSVMLCYSLARCADRAISGGGSSRFAAPKGSSCISNVVLVIFSLIFYAWGEPVYVALMLVSVVINYIAGLCIDRGERKSKAALVIGVALNIGMIAVFKYADFLVGTLNLFGLGLSQPSIALPIGISFYTFQSISYLVDVYRSEPVPDSAEGAAAHSHGGGQGGAVRRQSNFISLLLYISMFPQLIAGPIVRYSAISREIDSRSISFEDLAEGSFRFLVGLGKKVILANELSEISGQLLDGELGALTTGGAWLGLAAFTLQIYFDFSGYSDMAIGMGRCLGFHFEENFNYPYVSCTITEFWRRWHISLGSFFRDYVYIPLGGNRRHQLFNILFVWFLTGLWHGASWNFVLWGLYFGVIISLEKYTLLKVRDKIPSFFLHIYSLFVIILGWAIFYFDDLGRLGRFIGVLFGGGAGGWDLIAQNELTGNIWLLAAAALCCMPVGRLIRSAYERVCTRNDGIAEGVFTAAKVLCGAAILITSTLLLIGDTTNAFLYLRF